MAATTIDAASITARALFHRHQDPTSADQFGPPGDIKDNLHSTCADRPSYQIKIHTLCQRRPARGERRQ